MTSASAALDALLRLDAPIATRAPVDDGDAEPGAAVNE
jgi:hypothetical protein